MAKMTIKQQRDLVTLRAMIFEEALQIIISSTRTSPEHQRLSIEAFKKWRVIDRKLWRNAGCIKRWRYRTFFHNGSISSAYDISKERISEEGEESVFVPDKRLNLLEGIFTIQAPESHGDRHLIMRRLFKLSFLNELQGVHPRNCHVHINKRFVDPVTNHKILMISVYRVSR